MKPRMAGTKQNNDALRGTGFLQSDTEWEARNNALASTIGKLINQFIRLRTKSALDVGCEMGQLTDRIAANSNSNLRWYGIDPDVTSPQQSPSGAELLHGFAHELPFSDGFFDCLVFANVFEHISPEWRDSTFEAFNRVLVSGGIFVGQLPNPYFPIESHSRLPFFGYLPSVLRRWYWNQSPTGWEYEKAHFFIVTIRYLKKLAESHSFETVLIRNFNYPLDAIPKDVRWVAKLHQRLGLIPWSWQFVFCKK